MKKEITGNTLKWIAVITMFIDHIGAAILERGLTKGGSIFKNLDNTYNLADLILRLIGRLAFPIFCFLLIEGFSHTRNIKKYVLNMAVFSILSEIPFDYAFFGTITWKKQNVYFTLLIGLLMLCALKKLEEKQLKNERIFELLTLAVFAGAAQLMGTDYGAIGVILIFILYISRNDRKQQCILGAICMSYEITAIFAFPVIYLYNGKRKKGMNKYFFYFFYPIHLLFLYGIHYVIMQ